MTNFTSRTYQRKRTWGISFPTNSTYGAGAYFPEQMEFSILGGIKSSEIVGAYKKQGGKIIGDFIPNPNFGGN